MDKRVKTDSSARSEKDQGEFLRSVVSVRRVSTVRQGGKRFSFSALVVVGNGRGRAGYASGKAREVPEAVRKAVDRASRSMTSFSLKDGGRTLHHDFTGASGAGLVHVRSAPPGTGIIAGGAMRAVFEALGVQDVVTKSLRSSNPHNMIKATFNALHMIRSPRFVAQKRGRKISDIFRSYPAHSEAD